MASLRLCCPAALHPATSARGMPRDRVRSATASSAGLRSVSVDIRIPTSYSPLTAITTKSSARATSMPFLVDAPQANEKTAIPSDTAESASLRAPAQDAAARFLLAGIMPHTPWGLTNCLAAPGRYEPAAALDHRGYRPPGARPAPRGRPDLPRRVPAEHRKPSSRLYTDSANPRKPRPCLAYITSPAPE